MSASVETLTSIERPMRSERHVLTVLCEEQIIRCELIVNAAITFGRGQECGLRVDHRSVSRAHARFHGGAPVMVEDLESHNGTRVRGVPIHPKERVTLAPGDMLQCGEALLFLQSLPAEERSTPIGPRDPLALWPAELVAHSDQCSFEVAPGRKLDLQRRGPLRRVLLALLEQRRRHPGVPLSVEAVAAAGWPGERVQHESAVARVYTTVNRLRALGLGKGLVTRDDGYLLDPSLVVRQKS
jgi:hypothetical protein